MKQVKSMSQISHLQKNLFNPPLLAPLLYNLPYSYSPFALPPFTLPPLLHIHFPSL